MLLLYYEVEWFLDFCSATGYKHQHCRRQSKDMRRKQLPAKIARVVVWLFTAIAVGAMVFVLGPSAIGGALKIGRWDATVSSFSVTLLFSFGIWVLPDPVQNKLLRLWGLLNLVVGEILYALLVVLGYMRRWRIWFASLLLLSSPLAFLSVHRALRRHTRVARVHQLLEDVAEFVNEKTVAPGEAAVSANLGARHRALGAEAAIHAPHLSSLMKAIDTLFSEEFSEELEHECPTCYPTTVHRALDALSSDPADLSLPDAQLVVLLKAKAHIALSEQGRLMHHVFDAYEALRPLRDYIDSNPETENPALSTTMRSLFDNLWANVHTSCAGRYGEYVPWASGTRRQVLSQDELFREARSSHDAAFQTGSGYARARAANNRADLELRRLWLLDQDSRAESMDGFDPVVAGESTTMSSPIEGERLLVRYLGDLRRALRDHPRQIYFLTHAQADHFLARIYARRHATLHPNESSIDDWLSQAERHLDSSVRMLEMSLVSGLDFASLKNVPQHLVLEDLLLAETDLSTRFAGHEGVLEMYERERRHFREMLLRRRVDIETLSQAIGPLKRAGG